MKLFVVVLAALAVGSTANPLGGVPDGGGKGDAIGSVTQTLDGVFNPIIDVIDSLSDNNRHLAKSLNQLTVAVINAYSRIKLAARAISRQLNAIVAGASKNIEDIVSAVQKAVAALIQAVNVGLDSISGLFNFDGIIEAIEGIAISVCVAIRDLLQSFQSIFESLVAAAETELIAALQLILQSAIGIAAEILFNIEKLIAGVTGAINDVLSKAFSAVNQALSSVSAIVSDSEIVSLLQSIVAQLSSATSGLLSSPRGSLSDKLDNLPPLVGSVSDTKPSLTIDPAFSGIIKDISGAFDEVLKIINEAVTAVPSSVRGVLASTIIDFDKAISLVIASVAAITASDIEAAGSVNEISDRINFANSELLGALLAVMKIMISYVDEAISPELADVLEKIVCIVLAIAQMVVANVAVFLENVVANITNIADKLPAILSKTLNNILSSMKGGKENLLSEVLNDLEASVLSLVGSEFGVIPGVNAILGGTLASASGAIVSLPACLNGGLDNDKLSDALSSTLNGIVSSIADLAGTLSGALAAAVDALACTAANAAIITQTLGTILTSITNISNAI